MQNSKIVSHQPLADAIVLQAVADYRKALAGEGYGRNSPEDVMRECERFFRSNYFCMLTKISGEYLIEELRKEVQGEKNEQI